MRLNQHLNTLFDLSDLNRLNGENEIDHLISLSEIKNTIKNFKNSTPGESNINKTILKNVPDNALKILQVIFNHSLSIGYFPDKFKTAIIKLIPKPNAAHNNPINCRPISLLEVTGKILEKIINHRLKLHLETHNYISDTQHGFRWKRGIDTALATIYETIAHHCARRDQCYIVLRDVAKAFDKVWHLGLQYKISEINLPLTFTKFLNNFIKNRSAKIKIGSYIGPTFPLEAGVPQGSSLSPTLFTIYTRDIPQPVF